MQMKSFSVELDPEGRILLYEYINECHCPVTSLSRQKFTPGGCELIDRWSELKGGYEGVLLCQLNKRGPECPVLSWLVDDFDYSGQSETNSAIWDLVANHMGAEA